jgi:hypothetical protein
MVLVGWTPLLLLLLLLVVVLVLLLYLLLLLPRLHLLLLPEWRQRVATYHCTRRGRGPWASDR